MAESAHTHPVPIFSPAAAFLAWMLPGAGHIHLGQRKRGLLIMFGVLFLFFTGLLIGGVDSVDRRRDHLWFLAQAFNGPIAFAADFLNQRYTKPYPDDWVGSAELQQRYVERDPELMMQIQRTGIGHVNEMGTLFIALGGLMNLVVILDALHFVPPTQRDRRRRRKDDAA